MTATRPAGTGRWLSDVTAITAATVLLLLVWLLFSRPGSFGSDTVPGYLCCAAFAVLAVASSVAEAKASGRPVHLVEVVSALALWALLPLTLFLSVWLVLLASVFAVLSVIFLAAPLLLANAARLVARRGRAALGTGLLLVGLLYTVTVVALWAPALPLAMWLPVIIWHLLLALIAVCALGWPALRGRLPLVPRHPTAPDHRWPDC